MRAHLLAALMMTNPGLAAAATIFTTQAPASGNINNSRSIELGIRFRADTAGLITGLRFYKVAGNDGPHTGHLWTNTGALLGTLTFTGETASGWQTASFASPIPISSGTPYVASYHTTLYAVTRFYFSSAEVSSPPLHALQDGASGPNGLYAYSSAPVFPTQGTRSSNYWVDVVFTSSPTVPTVTSLEPSSATAGGAGFVLRILGTGFTPGSTGRWNGADRATTFISPTALSIPVAAADLASAGTALVTVFTSTPGGGLSNAAAFSIIPPPPVSTAAATIFTTQAPASGNINNSRSIELGVRFRADTAGLITGLRFYKVAGNDGPHTGHLWTNTGALLGTLTFTGETASGWQAASFASPIPISSGTPYVASYHTTLYAATRAYFADEVSNPPLHALQDGAAGPNGLYAYSSAPVFPTQGTRSSNYWVDVVFVSSQPAPPVDSEAPSVSIASPAEGALLAGAVAVTAAAADNVAVTTVQFRLDGADLGPPDAAAPYVIVWNTAVSSDGTHGLSAVAWDAAGNASTSAAVAVTVDNTAPLISAVVVTDIGISSAALAWLTDEPATAQVEYGTSTSYGNLTALDVSTVTAHSRILTGLAAGTLYHYRARSADGAGNVAVSDDATFTTAPPPPAPSCLTSAGAWQNFPFPPMSGSFVAEFTATPHTAGMDGVMGLSNGPASAFTHLADIVRFNTAGFIDARDGGAYAAAGPIPYSPGIDYHFTLEVDLASHTYTAYVSSPSAARQLVGSDFAFRTEQSAVTSLDNMGFIAGGGSETVCGLSVYSDDTPPLISSVAVTDIGISSAALSWLTDEPATSQVEYGTTTSYGSATALDLSTVTSHAQVVLGLSSGTLYHYRVRSADAAGNLAVSDDFTFTTTVLPDLTPPSVELSSPVAGAVVAGTVAVVASAFDDVAVATVQFRLDGADLGPPDFSPPYAFAWDTAASSDGPHALDAVAWDAAGNASTSAAVAVTVDNTPPLISSVAVTDIGISSAALSWLTDEPATSQVEYGTTTSYGSATALDLPTVTSHAQVVLGLSSGTLYHYRVRSADAAGNLAVSDDFTFTTTVLPDLTPPSVELSSPVAGAVVAGTVAVVASAFDDVAVATVQFRLDGADLGPPDFSPPYAFAWDTAASSDGPHALDAVAWDAAGNASTSAAVSVTVDNTPPSVSISSPAGGSVVAGTVAVIAAAFDGVAVAAVQFRLDGADLGPPDAAAPYEIAWNTALSSDGAHGLSAVAWDAAGNASTSAAVSVTADNTAPLISAVAAGSVAITSATVTWATDEPATTQVEYGTTTAYGSSTALDLSTAISHAQVVIGLSSGTLYHYRVRSIDAAGNLAVSGGHVFTTTVFVGTPTVVSLTFDDGTISHVLAGDVLDEKGVKGTFYVNSGRIGGSAAFMNLAQVRSLAAGGHEIGGHTINHLDLTTLAPEQLEQQICGDRAALIAMGFTPASLAYPFGAFNAAVAATTAGCGYASGRTVGGLSCVGCPKTAPIPPPDAFAVPTPDSVKNTTTLAAMQQMVTDAEQAGGGWVPVVMHLVCEDCGTLAVSSNTLAAFIDWVKPREAAGTVIKTMAQAIGADDAPPSVSISSPAAGALLSGAVAVAAAAFDNVSVATVQFKLDGADLGPPDHSSPYAAAWNTALSSDGAHALSAVAWDASGFASTSAPVLVSVDNTPPLIGAVAVTDIGISSAALAWLTDEPATSQVEYGTTTAYGSLTALDASTVASHAQVLSGLASGTTHHFRVRSADAAGNLALSDDATFTTAPAGFGCLTSAGDWRNQAFPPQVSSFTVAFDVMPSSAGMNASIGVSSGATGALAGLAAAVRFNPQGFIDVRYSTAYARMSTVAYSTGTSYHFDLRVNAAAHLFDAYVTPQGSSRVMLARNYPFHSNQSTSTVLGNLGLLASPGAATMCSLTVAASTVPWWDGIKEVYATAAGSKTWYSTWDNGINRAFGRAVDPIDRWFDANHGSASYIVDADSGVFKITGSVPRMYIHHPEFVMGSNSLTVADAHAKQWRDVEMTVYGMRVADSNVAWAGIDGIARANHGMTGDETVDLCDTRGIGARFRYNGRLDFEKETRHPTSYAINTTTTSLWPSGTSMPFNVWIGFKYVVYDLPNGNVKVESYMDMTNGAAGGTWVPVNQFEDDGTNWGGGTPCAEGINPRERLTNAASRPGSESGLPNVSVYFRSDGVGTNGLLYKKMSVREIISPAAPAPPLAAAGAEAQAAEAAGAAPAAAGDEFVFRDLYAFPNPSRRGERVTIRLQAGLADAVDVDIYDLTGRRVNGGAAAGPVPLDDGNGKGPQLTYDYHWNVSGAASAVYLYSVKARKAGYPEIGKTGKVAVIR